MLTREPYAYAHNNPINLTDPSGLSKCEVGLNPPRWGVNAQACADDAVDWVVENPKEALTYTAIGLGGAALIIGTAGAATPGLTVLGVSAGSAATGLSIGSTAASLAVAGIDCSRGWSADCAASTAEALGGGVTTYFGGSVLVCEWRAASWALFSTLPRFALPRSADRWAGRASPSWLLASAWLAWQRSCRPCAVWSLTHGQAKNDKPKRAGPVRRSRPSSFLGHAGWVSPRLSWEQSLSWSA